MYYPYFRGKQYELITIRENAGLLRDSGFIPIIEPVKEAGLSRSIDEIKKVKGKCILIVNPTYGVLSRNNRRIRSICKTDYDSFNGLSAGILLTSKMTTNDVIDFCREYSDRTITLIHNGFKEGRSLATAISGIDEIARHVFFEPSCGKLYRKHFGGIDRILLRDGFQKRINRDHPDVELFSDLHITYGEEGMDGFGDFLVVGDEYSETGGPAYAVAIHLTFIDPRRDDEMYIYHFKSDRTDTPTDPAGKFAEALSKLVHEVNRRNSHIYHSQAVEEFLELHRTDHYPGLGYVKKLSMQHHIETLADFLV